MGDNKQLSVEISQSEKWDILIEQLHAARVNFKDKFKEEFYAWKFNNGQIVSELIEISPELTTEKLVQRVSESVNYSRADIYKCLSFYRLVCNNFGGAIENFIRDAKDKDGFLPAWRDLPAQLPPGEKDIIEAIEKKERGGKEKDFYETLDRFYKSKIQPNKIKISANDLEWILCEWKSFK